MLAPDVSIILPVYNAGPDLAASLVRLERACTDSSEVIIVDDGSTDGTDELVRRYAARKPSVNAIVLDHNSGVAAARNLALRQAKGEFVWFVDWDDEWHEDIVRVLLARARATNADIVVCRSTWRSPTGLDLGHTEKIPAEVENCDKGDAFDLVLRGDLKGYLWSKLLRRAILKEDMFPPMHSMSDFCGLVPILAAARNISYEPKILYHHVIRDGSITNSRQHNLDNFTKCRQVVRDVAAELPASPRRDLLLLHYDYAFLYIGRVNTALRLSSMDVVRAELAAARPAMHFQEIVRIARVSPRTAVRSGLLKAFGSMYPWLRHTYVNLRQRLRSSRSSFMVLADHRKSGQNT